jgi:single-strand DNA-binding protein
MYQKVIVIGNLGQDPELRYTNEGTPVVSFPVATNERWTDKDGVQQERTTWFRISAWRRLAETCNEYLSKGRQVMVEGRMNPDPETGGPKVFNRNDGSPGASYELTAFTVKFLGSPGDSVASGGAVVDTEVDEIPF